MNKANYSIGDLNDAKSFEIISGDQDVTSKFLSETPICSVCECKNNLYNKSEDENKSDELIDSQSIINSSLEPSDDEIYDLFTKKKFICCTRSTQTNNDNYLSTPDIHIKNGLNHPATIINSSVARRTATPNPYTQELIITRAQLYNTHRNYQKLKTRFHKLHADYEKLMGIAGVLTTSLQKSVAGEIVDLHETLQTCMRIYPDIFNAHECKVGFTDPNITTNFSQKNFNITRLSIMPISPKFLDYKKIKLHLVNGNIKTKLLLLQALRWKITLSQPDERDEAMEEFIKNDLLCFNDNEIIQQSEKSILPYLLIHVDFYIPYTLQQCTTRLLNTFASLKAGRDYLSRGPTVLNVIIQCLDSTRIKLIDAFTCDMIIATLQKLSLRRRQRLYMISAGLVEWLVYHLKAEYQVIGTYRLEYATALLMNLSLQKEAQIRAAAMARILISTLIMLLSSEHFPALPYVNGALNNFLANRDINEEARIIGLGSILEYHRQYRSGELRKHLDHILLRHRRKNNETIEEDIKDDDDKEELDILEDELDEMDPVKVEPEDLFGETLLTSCYSLSMKVLQNDNKFISCSLSKICDESVDKFIEADDNKFPHEEFPLCDKGLSPRESNLTAGDLRTLVSSRNGDTIVEKCDIARDYKDGLTSSSNVNKVTVVSGLVEDGEEAFIAKPKISRTPPHSLAPIKHE